MKVKRHYIFQNSSTIGAIELYMLWHIWNELYIGHGTICGLGVTDNT